MGRRIVGGWAAALPLALALGLATAALAPQAACADEGVPIAVVQNMAPIGSDEELAALQPTGYGSQHAASPNALAAPKAQAPCGSSLVPEVPEGLPAGSAAAPLARGRAATEHQVGEVRTFSSEYYEDGTFEARMVAAGERFTLWIEEGCLDLLGPDDLEALSSEIDDAIAKMHESFGTTEAYDIDGDGKTAFVFYLFDEGMSHAAGYFWWPDLFSEEALEHRGIEGGDRTNHMDMLHLNVENMIDGEGFGYFDKYFLMPVLVHELQHFINFAQTDGNAELWLNEVFSQAAGAVAGYGYGSFSNINLLRRYAMGGSTPPFVFEGQYVPSADTTLGALAYGQWFLFSRYLANQTRGCEGGGDALYKSVLEPDASGLGACTTERLMEALERMGYAGDGPGSVVADFDELVFNYNTALAVRDSTGPCSLTNDEGADPSLIDGIPFYLLLVEDVASEVAGGGAAAFAEVEDAARPRLAGASGVQERRLVSPLPLRYELMAGPPVGARPREGELVSIVAPQLEGLPGARIGYVWATEQELDELNPLAIPFEEYTEPTPFSSKAPVLFAQFSCDRGSTPPTYFVFESAPDLPEEDGESPGEAPGGQEASGVADPAVKLRDVADPAGGPQAVRPLASTGDSLASAQAAALALACASALAAALRARRRMATGRR